jgi:hypothetical protein
MSKRFLLPSLVLLLGFGCNKEEENTPPPDIASVITFTAPTAGTIFLNGTQLQVAGTVSDDQALSAVKVEIRNASNGSILFQQNNPTGNVIFYGFTWNWNITGITTQTNAIVKVIATDRYNYQVSKEVAVVLID